jgi:hypothetical protein
MSKWTAVLLALVLALTPRVLLAQDAEPPLAPLAAPLAPVGPSAGDIAGAVLGGLGDVIGQALTAWFSTAAPVILGRLVAGAFGFLADQLWHLAGGVLQGVNIFTQLPPGWSYDLQPVGELRARLTPVARAVLLLALVLGVLWAGLGTVIGRPFGRLYNHIGTFLLATGGLLAAPQLTRWWIDLCNALSAALLGGDTGLPGLAAVQGWERLSALGVVAVIYLVVALLLLLNRLKLIVYCVLLLAVAPLGIAAGALPVPPAQRFFRWWLATFLGVTFVQVLQAACLGIGGWLISAPLVAGRVEGPGEGLLSAGVGTAAILAAMSLPQMLLGSLARANLAPGVLYAALHAATMLAGFGVAWRAIDPALRTAVYTVVPRPGAGLPASPGAAATFIGGGYVSSLLGGAPPPALPPPRP